MNVIAIIQARMRSSRLPGKILKPLGQHNVLTYVVERCKKIMGVRKVIVATSTLPQDDQVEEWCKTNQVSCYRGSEEDVLDRYFQAAKSHFPDYVIRVTADCPFVDYELASEMIGKMQEAPSDFIELVGELPRGLAVELFSFNSLGYIHRNGLEHRHREHVTYYAYENRNEFSWTSMNVDEAIQQPHLRITLDTEEDYELCSKVANHLNGNFFVTSKEVINYLITNPDIAKINAHIEQKPVV